MVRLLRLISLWISLTALSSCGGSSDGTSSAEPEPPAAPTPPPAITRTGFIVPVPIEGLSYRTPTKSGTTSSVGGFDYVAGEVVTFSLGDLEIGSAAAADEISVFDLRGAITLTDVRQIISALNDPESAFTSAANALRTLYTLDADLNADNGISLSVDASEPLDFDLMPRLFAYSATLQTLLTSEERQLMPLYTVLAHHYREADVSITEDGTLISRPTETTVFELFGGDVLESTERTSYRYDDQGNLTLQETFDGREQLARSVQFQFDATGLRTGRIDDFDGDGRIDFEQSIQHNHGGDVVRVESRLLGETPQSSVAATSYNERGLVREVTVTQGDDGVIVSRTTTLYGDDNLTSRIEVWTGVDSEQYVITERYDAQGLLIEQTFTGRGTDVHDFLDRSPPDLAVDHVDPFDPRHPYWGARASFLAGGPPPFTSRHTRYIRDAEGRVTTRETDLNGDGEPDRTARLTFEEDRPRFWRYDGNGDGIFESTGTYSYTAEGRLRAADVRRERSQRLATVFYDENNRRELIETVDDGAIPTVQRLRFIYDHGLRMVSSSSGDSPEDPSVQTAWRQSYRIDDSILSAIVPQNR